MYNMYRPRSISKRAFTSVMYHEMTHVYQWHGNFGAPGGLTEGTADYVMVKSGFYNEDFYTKPGVGTRWDEGLEGFTAKLNQKMKYKYSDVYWAELVGKPVEQLWREYKAKYGNKLEEDSIDMLQGLK